MNSSKAFLVVFALALATGQVFSQAFTIPSNQITIVVAPGFDHAEVRIPVTTSSGFSLGSLGITSDSPEVVPSVVTESGAIRLQFKTRSLLVGKVATLALSGGGTTSELFVNLNVSPLDVYRLIEDSSRAVIYGIHMNGVESGAIFNFDPRSGSHGQCLTVGKRPTDFVISRDGSELFVICSAEKAVYVIDLNAFAVKEVIGLPTYGVWGSAKDTIGRIYQGPADILYYIDSAWGPTLHVFNRATRQVIQSIQYLGGNPSNTTGFQGIAFTSDFSKAVAMPQYGWSAGVHTPSLAGYNVASNGTLTFTGTTSVTTGLQREPFAAPALISEDNSAVFLKTVAVSPGNINDIRTSFPLPVWSISRGGHLAATATDIYEVQTGKVLASIPNATADVNGYLGTKPQAFTSNYQHFVYFDSKTRTLNSLDISSAVSEVVGVQITPTNESVVLPPAFLKWRPFSGISTYRVYLGTSEDAVLAADTNSPEYLGTFNGDSAPAPASMQAGMGYFWRVDAVVPGGTSKGTVFSFKTALVAPVESTVNISLVAAEVPKKVTLPLLAASAEPWQASENADWLTLTPASGTAPGALSLTVDPKNLAAGVYQANVEIECDSGKFVVPVSVRIHPMHLKHLRSDRNSSLVYGISEDTSVPGSKAFLLEIDSQSERVLRSVEVGLGVTDIELHGPEGRIYVTNHSTGQLLALNRETFSIERTYAFTPWGEIGYTSGDVFQVAAGTNGRLVIEAFDQWVDIEIFNTATGKSLATAGVREGGGVFDSTGRYYYHGENNSTGAELIRYDVTGDAFTELASNRPDGLSYYGSRTVIISENNQRVFWANVVFNAAIQAEWVVGEPIYSTNRDGRLAFGENNIVDVNRRLKILGMPSSTKVSAYNTMTSKLVAPVNGVLGFFPLQLPISSLAAPEFLDPVSEGPELTNIMSAQLGRSVLLRWIDRSLETGFHVQYRKLGEAAWQDVSGVSPSAAQNATQLLVTGLQPTTTYEFRMRSVSPELSSTWVGPITATTPILPPPVPWLIQVSAPSPFEVSLVWTATGDYDGIRIERKQSGSAFAWETVTEIHSQVGSYLDRNVEPDTEYLYRVNTFSGSLTSGSSNELWVRTRSLAPPEPPTNLVGEPSGAYSVALSWSSVPSATEYRIERRIGEVPWSAVATIDSANTGYTDTGLTHGTYYNYRVVAVNAIGEAASTSVLVLSRLTGPILSESFDPWISSGNWSSYTNAFISGDEPGFRDGNALWFGGGGTRSATTIPVGVSAGGSLQFSIRGGNESVGGSGWWDRAEADEQVVVEFSTIPGRWQTLATVELADVNYQSWSDVEILLPAAARSAGTSFRWRQVAHSGPNFDTWAIDDVSVIGLLPPPPPAPSFILANANSATAAAISWSAAPGSISYQIQRRTPSTDWEIVGSTGAQTFFTDSTAQPATSYSYRVLAWNNSGYSDPSQHAFVTTWSILQEWRFQNYGTVLAEGAAADVADNGTGISNLLRFAFNMSKDDQYSMAASAADRKGLPFIKLQGDKLQIAFVRRRDALQAGLEYAAEFSDNMVDWQQTGTEIFAENIDEEFEFVIVRDGGATNASRFGRVRVIKK